VYKKKEIKEVGIHAEEENTLDYFEMREINKEMDISSSITW